MKPINIYLIIKSFFQLLNTNHMKFNTSILKLCYASVFSLLFLASCTKEEVITPSDLLAIEERGATLTTSPATGIYGLSDNNELLTITAGPPVKVTEIKPITGLKSGDRLVAIDIRPATQQLYGLSASGNLYVIDRTTAAAKLISLTPVSPELAGSMFGFDFNPRTDRIRIVTDKGQNITVNPTTGTVTSVDANVNPTLRVNSIAYANSTSSTSAALLYDISSADGKLYAQQEAKGFVSAIGSTGLVINGEGGFDISRNNASVFAVLTARSADATGGGTVGLNGDDLTQEANRLYAINLRTGRATSYGKLGHGIIGIAVQ